MNNDVNAYVLDFINGNGNVMVSARNKLKKSTIANMDRITADYNNVKVVTDEGIAIPLGVDRTTGAIVWAHMDITISTKQPAGAAVRPVATKKIFQVKEQDYALDIIDAADY